MPLAVKDERIAIDGVGIETRWIGSAAGGAPTLVMLHEGLGCIASWGHFPERLAETTGCGVFLYSRAGYGGSDPCLLPRPLRYMHDEALQVLPKLLDAVALRRGFLLGHSDGASIAAIHAGGIQDHRVRGLVLLAPHFFVEEMCIRAIERARGAFEAGDLRARLVKLHGSNVDCAFHGWNGAWLDPEFRRWDIREHLAYIRVPILIAQGAEDPYGTVAQLDAAQEETYCPVEIELLEGCGHAPHYEKPAETLAAVSGFLNRLIEVHGEAAPLRTPSFRRK
jgi:pimeloyl-ACP methyl ester carboxylesterase